MSIQAHTAGSAGDSTSPRYFGGFWDIALELSKQELKKKGLPQLPVAEDLTSRLSNPGEVIDYFEHKEELSKIFRWNGEKIRGILTPFVGALLPFLDAGAEGAAVRRLA